MEQSMNIAQGEYSSDRALAYEAANYIAEQVFDGDELAQFKKDIVEVPIDVK